MQCSGCKYWLKPEADEWEQIRKKMGVCKRTAHIDDMTTWDEAADDCRRVILPEFYNHTAAVSDASGHAATLFTAGEHFCAMFAARQEATNA